jgi:uncharacterized membrane protein YbhN (UPF0104 family)
VPTSRFADGAPGRSKEAEHENTNFRHYRDGAVDTVNSSKSSPPTPLAVGPSPPRRLRLVTIAKALRWLLLTVLVVLTLRLMVVDPAPIWRLGNIQTHVLVSMVSLMVLNQWLMSLRFKLVMKRCAGAQLSHWRWFQVISVGQFLNLFVPQLGHLYRASVLERQVGLSYTAYATGLFVYSWFEVLVGTLLAVVVVASHDCALRVAGVPVLPLLAVGLTVLFLLPWVVDALVSRAQFRSNSAVSMLDRARDSLARARVALRDRTFVAAFVVLNLAVTVEHVVMLALAFHAVGGGPGINRLVLFQVLLKLTNQIAITPGNVGISELAYGALSGASSTSAQHGIAAALVIRTLGTLVIVGLGLASGAGSVLRQHRREVRSSAAPQSKPDRSGERHG